MCVFVYLFLSHFLLRFGLPVSFLQMIQTSRTLIESADSVYCKLTQSQRAGENSDHLQSKTVQMHSCAHICISYLNNIRDKKCLCPILFKHSVWLSLTKCAAFS